MSALSFVSEETAETTFGQLLIPGNNRFYGCEDKWLTCILSGVRKIPGLFFFLEQKIILKEKTVEIGNSLSL